MHSTLIVYLYRTVEKVYSINPANSIWNILGNYTWRQRSIRLGTINTSQMINVFSLDPTCPNLDFFDHIQCVNNALKTVNSGPKNCKNGTLTIHLSNSEEYWIFQFSWPTLCIPHTLYQTFSWAKWKICYSKLEAITRFLE